MFSRNPYRRPAIIAQGMRPHWLRSALLLLLVVVVIVLPPSGNQPDLTNAQPAPRSIVGSLPPVPDNQAELRTAIDRANSAFRTAHVRADVAALDGVATGAWLDDERRSIADLQASSTTEHWTLRSFMLLSLLVRDTTATACTDEQWERVIIGADGQAGSAELRQHIERYTLVRVGAAWLVSQIDYDAEECRV